MRGLSVFVRRPTRYTLLECIYVSHRPAFSNWPLEVFHRLNDKYNNFWIIAHVQRKNSKKLPP